jgi:thymidylate synthase
MHTQLPPVIDEYSERVAWQLQEQEDFEQEQHDAEVAQRLFENDDSSSRQNRGRVDQLSNVLQDIERSSPSSTSEVNITRH